MRTHPVLLALLPLSLLACGGELTVLETCEPPACGAPEPPLDPDEGVFPELDPGIDLATDAAIDPCIDLDLCPEEGPLDAEPEPGGPLALTETDLVPGTRLLTRMYAPLRTRPSRNAPLREAIDPGRGVHNGEHGGGQPKGVIPPAQKVTVVDSVRRDGYVKVRYDGATGWVKGFKLAPLDRSLHPVDYAKRASVRQAFFKLQFHDGRWNKDGPWTSSNCAPTSLAMAIRIFGKEPRHLSVEESIHRVRRRYDSDLDHGASSTSDIYRTALALGMEARYLSAYRNADDNLRRLDRHLGRKHVVLFAGLPTAGYKDALRKAFARADRPYRYNVDVPHMILVIGRTSSGKYLVADPAARVGVTPLSRSALRAFISKWGGGGVAVWAP